MTNSEILKKGEVAPGDMVARWHFSFKPPIRPAVDLILPGDCFFRNNIFHPDIKGLRRVEAGFLKVSPVLRGSGIGERLVRGLGALSQKYACPEIFLCIASQYSFDILERVYGRERMEIHHVDGYNLRGVSPSSTMGRINNANFEEVRQTLVDLAGLEADLELRDHGFPITVDLDGLDTTDWELPLDQATWTG